MIHEKTFTLETGRFVKVIAKAKPASDLLTSEPEIEVLIKEPKEENFHPPIGVAHPKYWKLKRLNTLESKTLQIKYSGIKQKHLRKTIKEFQRLTGSDIKSSN